MPRIQIGRLVNNLTGSSPNGLSFSDYGTLSVNGNVEIIINDISYQPGNMVIFSLTSANGIVGDLPYISSTGNGYFGIKASVGDTSTYSYVVFKISGSTDQTGSVVAFSPAFLPGYSFYTSGSRADVTNGAFSYLSVLGGRPNLIAAGGPIVSNGVITFDGIDDNLAMPIISTFTSTISIQSAIDLPTASGSGVNGGFTCTGRCLLPSGYWVEGNDGRSVEGDSSNNLTASVVILTPDETTVFLEITMASLGIAGTTKSVQGVVYIPTVDQFAIVLTTGSGGSGVGRVHFFDATTFVYLGEWTVNGNPVGDIVNLNGIAYDQTRDCLILLSVNVTPISWRNRLTGVVIMTMAINPSLANDHLQYDNDTGILWMSTGNNGFNGHIQGFRASCENPIMLYDITCTGADAIEGFVIRNGILTLNNDAGYHTAGNPRKNRVLTYTMPALPVAPIWPISKNAQFYGIIRISTAATAAARIITGIGNSLTNTTGGVSASQPISVINQLRAVLNGTTGTSTTVAMSTKVLFFMNIDALTDTFEVWINGVSLISGALSSPTTTDFVDRAPPYVGSDRGINRFFLGEITCIAANVGEISSREKLEWYAANDTGNMDLLPISHPYKNTIPTI